MGGIEPRAVVLAEVLERITARFAPMLPNGLGLPGGEDTIQLRIGTLVAETSWPEISELVGVQNAKGDHGAVTAAFPAIEDAVRQRHGLTRRLLIRVPEEVGRGDRLVNWMRLGGLRRDRGEWLVWGDGRRWREEP